MIESSCGHGSCRVGQDGDRCEYRRRDTHALQPPCRLNPPAHVRSSFSFVTSENAPNLYRQNAACSHICFRKVACNGPPPGTKRRQNDQKCRILWLIAALMPDLRYCECVAKTFWRRKSHTCDVCLRHHCRSLAGPRPSLVMWLSASVSAQNIACLRLRTPLRSPLRDCQDALLRRTNSH